jgi:hypothetical protein
MLFKKVSTFSALSPIKMVHQGLPEGGCAPSCLEGFKGGGSPPHRQEKPFTTSQFIEKLKHFEISFDEKTTMQNIDFWQI